MEISRSCKVRKVNWEAAAELPSRFERLGAALSRQCVRVSHYPDEYEFETLSEAIGAVRRLGPPRRYLLRLTGSVGKDDDFTFSLMRDWNIHKQEFLSVAVSAPQAEAFLQAAMSLLDLEPATLAVTPVELARTAFIAHRFDEIGSSLAGAVARFLELLDFRASTGRGYSPGSVAEKVRGRIDASAIVVVVLTPGAGDTWLVQESVIGQTTGKPLVVIRAADAEFTPGLLADHEYIPFDMPHIERTFMPLLEGLRELGYSFSDSDVAHAG